MTPNGPQEKNKGLLLELESDADHILIPKDYDCFPDTGYDMAIIRLPSDKQKILLDYLYGNRYGPKFSEEAKKQFRRLGDEEFSRIKDNDWEKTFENR